MKNGTLTKDEARIQAACQRAKEITNQSWLDNEMSPEELAQNQAVEERLMRFLGDGLTLEEAMSRLAAEPIPSIISAHSS